MGSGPDPISSAQETSSASTHFSPILYFHWNLNTNHSIKIQVMYVAGMDKRQQFLQVLNALHHHTFLILKLMTQSRCW